MLRRKKGGISWLEFELLQGLPLAHAVFIQPGLERPLEERWRAVQPDLPLEAGGARAEQVHGKALARAREPRLYGECDGLSTNQERLPLFIRHADCQAALFYDPVRKAAANVHCGWRGSLFGIYREAVVHMKRQYGSLPEELIVCIGPSLGPKSAEFIHFKRDFPEIFWRFEEAPGYFNFWEISRWQLEESGILPSRIEIASIDSATDPLCCSWRRDKTALRQESAIALL